MKGFTTTFTACKNMWSRVSVAMSLMLMAFLFSVTVSAQYGIAPVNPPPGGFNIDGRVVKASDILYGINWAPGGDWAPTFFNSFNSANYPGPTATPNPTYAGIFGTKLFHKID